MSQNKYKNSMKAESIYLSWQTWADRADSTVATDFWKIPDLKPICQNWTKLSDRRLSVLE